VCAHDKSKNVINVKEYYEIPSRNELAMEQAVATVGPIAAGIDASQP
jgi:hypothetical protein